MVDTSTAPTRRAPQIVAVLLTAILAALVVVLFVWIRPDRTHHEAKVKAQGLTALEQSAVRAASLQVNNMLTYKRATFASDYARTEAGATGALLTDLKSKEPTLQQQMTSGKFDLQGAITASAYEQSSGNSYLVLVSAQGYTLPDGGTRTLQTTARFEIIMVRTGNAWLASTLTSVGLI